MSALDLLVRAPRAVTPAGERAVAVGVTGGRIAVVTGLGTPEAGGLAAATTLDLADDEVLLPGLVDAHVHVNEPGRTAWEGFDSATRAAARGGVTTVVDMPLNAVPPTTTAANLAVKADAARGLVHVDVGFWGGAVPGNIAELEGLVRAGVFGAKCFTAPSGVEEFGHLDAAQLAAALAETHRLGSVLLVHAEDPEVLDAAARRVDAAGAAAHGGSRAYARFLATRPPAAEDAAVQAVVDAVRATGGRAHVVHLASAGALPLLAAARAEGLPVTAETCPHHLALDAAAVPDGATEYKCCPPVRDRATQDALWAALADGTIGSVVSDHSPCTPDLKLPAEGDFLAAWGGIASVQLALPVVWTAARARGVALADVVGWMAAAPADRLGLSGRKGSLVVGADADLVVFAPEEEFVVDPAALAHRHPVTPYAGARLRGAVRSTRLRGEPVDGATPRGHLLRAGGAR